MNDNPVREVLDAIVLFLGAIVGFGLMWMTIYIGINVLRHKPALCEIPGGWQLEWVDKDNPVCSADVDAGK